MTLVTQQLQKMLLGEYQPHGAYSIHKRNNLVSHFARIVVRRHVTLNDIGRGRVSTSAEHNFFCDPEAAHITLYHMTCPLYIMPYEICLKLHCSWVTF